MSVHPDGTGTGWTNVEAVDIDQPHGKDYLYALHIAKGIRKRSNKEHKAYGDSTAGGEHLPGGCRILAITDATADITAGAGDKTGIDITDGLFKGRGLIYDQTTNSLWCYTGDGTVSDDPYELKWSPRSVCRGADFTWTGEFQHDASVYFNNPIEASTVDITGHLYVDSSSDISDLYVNGDISISGTLKVATDFTLSGDMAVDGTSNFYDEVDVSSFNVSGIVSMSGTDTTEDSDNASFAKDVTYQVSTDGILVVDVSHVGNTVNWKVFVDSTQGMTTTSSMYEVLLSTATVAVIAPVTAFIPRNNYWCITIASGTLYRCKWYPFGDGSCDKNI